MSELTIMEELEELSAAEDFLNFFNIEYDQSVVSVNRLHILQRFHDYLQQEKDIPEDDEDRIRELYTMHLKRAYQDFVESDAVTEKVFKVFKMQGPQTTFVPVDQLLGS